MEAAKASERNLIVPPERELSQLAAPPKNRSLRIEDNPRSASGQNRWRQCRVAPEDGCGIMCLPGVTASEHAVPDGRICSRTNGNSANCRAQSSFQGEVDYHQNRRPDGCLAVALGFVQGWASSRCYKPDHVAGFHMGVLHGILMPAALPGLLMGNDLPIYAPNNSGRTYNIGYALGVNSCGTIFFGVSLLAAAT